MSRANYAGPNGLAGYESSTDEAFRALEMLPPAVRKRLTEATVPIPPAFVLAYWNQQIYRQGR